jgi:hypothetical protein
VSPDALSVHVVPDPVPPEAAALGLRAGDEIAVFPHRGPVLHRDFAGEEAKRVMQLLPALQLRAGQKPRLEK